MKKSLTPKGVLVCLLLSFNAECAEPPVVAVLDFEREVIPSSTTQELSKCLREKLTETHKVIVLPKERMRKILKEQREQWENLVGEKYFLKLAEILDVENLILGKISKSNPENYILYIELINSKEKTAFERNVKLRTDWSNLHNRIEKLADEIAKAISLRGKVVKIEGNNIYIDLGSEAGLEPGMTLRIEGPCIIPTKRTFSTHKTLWYEKEKKGELEVKEIIGSKLAIASKKNEKSKIELNDVVLIKEHLTLRTYVLQKAYEYWEVTVKPRLLMKYYVKPEYPEFAEKSEIEGQVILKLLIDEKGRVIDIKVVKSLNELLDAAAIKAVSKWRYSPAKQRDKPVKVWVVQPVRFQLKR